jgi:hypothetical protein
MNRFVRYLNRAPSAFTLLLNFLVAAAPVLATTEALGQSPVPPPSPVNEASAQHSGVHDFDFQFGSWRVHHRVKRTEGWIEFDGSCTDRPAMGGAANVEEHVFERPGGRTRAMGVRAYDPKTGLWAIWWVDSRDPHLPLDPPVKGRFVEGVGTFYSEGMVDGKTVRTRYTWSDIGRNTAHWEQAQSVDSGRTWETNWIMQFRRVSSARHPR